MCVCKVVDAYESKNTLLINDHYLADEYHKNLMILYIYHSCIPVCILLLLIPNESYSSLTYKLLCVVTSFLMVKLCTVR